MKLDEIHDKMSAVQRYALLLAESNNLEPVRGKLWFQKEMFLVSEGIAELADELGYEPSLKGPMSDALEWNVDQLEAVGLIERRGGAFALTEAGRECADLIKAEVDSSKLAAIAEMKGLLNDLPKDELLALVYYLHPDMTTESEELGALEPKRKDLAVRLFAKGKVGLEKGAVVADLPVQDFAKLLREKGVSRYSA